MIIIIIVITNSIMIDVMVISNIIMIYVIIIINIIMIIIMEIKGSGCHLLTRRVEAKLWCILTFLRDEGKRTPYFPDT